jgi:hypothetical protein
MKRIIGVEYDPNFLSTLQGILVVDIVDPPAVSPTRHLPLGDGSTIVLYFHCAMKQIIDLHMFFPISN